MSMTKEEEDDQRKEEKEPPKLTKEAKSAQILEIRQTDS